MKSNTSTPLSILIVEDNSVDATLLRTMLGQSRLFITKLECAESLGEALSILAEDNFDVILLDLNLPDSKGLDTLVSIAGKYPRVALVVVTGEYSEDFGLEAIALGAQEYLVKGGYDKRGLTKSIYYAIERKKAELALLSAEQRYRTIFENSAVAITVADERRRLVSWNKFTESLLEMDKGDLYLRPVKSLYPASEWERIKSFDLKEKGMQHHFETQMVKKGGRLIEVDISLSALRNSEGETIGSVCVITDITERKRIYEILERKQKNLQAIFDAAPVGMLLVDGSTIVKRVNYAVSQMLHREYSDIINRPLSDALGCVDCIYDEQGCMHGVTWATCPWLRTIQEAHRAGRHVRDLEIHAHLKVDNADVTPWLLVSAEPVTIDGHKRVVIAIDDITERKRAEEKLTETMELKSQFIATVSHELRTPLACVKEAIAVILDGAAGKVNGKQGHFLDIAKRNIERLVGLINDVLDFQGLEARKTTLNIQQNDIDQVLGEVYETMAPSARSKNVDISIEPAGGMGQGRFDRDKIIQAVTNLVGNAIKFTPEGGRVCLSVRCEAEELAISVSDTGIGIPRDCLGRIFDRFYRVPRPGDQVQGTGLGLAIVHKIVMMHGGRVEVESEQDHGTTFTIFLPLADKATSEVTLEKAEWFI